nr:SDR family oxidoreductase [Microbacterium agarici]
MIVADDLFNIRGKLALVTGANRGIGRSFAKALATRGADIIGVSASMPSDGGPAGADVRALGRSFDAHRVDFANVNEVSAFGDSIATGERPIDILVNNAGTIVRYPTVDHPLDEWQRVIDVNLTSQFALTQAIGRQMLDRRAGKVIFTTSLRVFQGGNGVASYTASKSALAGIVRTFSNEWAEHGIGVNGIAPGYIETENTRALREDAPAYDAVKQRIPVGRWGQPDDLSGALIFLASRASDYVSGVILPVDGGWLGR